MREWSMGEAIGSGFRLIRREPVAFLAWSAVYGVVGLGPQVASAVFGFRAMSKLPAAGAGDPQALAAAMAPLQTVQPISLIGGLAAAILLYGAVYRAILFPDDRRFLYLRFGARELWMALTSAALVIMFVLGLFAMMIPVLIVTSAAAFGGGSSGLGALIVIPLFLGLFVAAIWAACRLALAVPMSFAQRNFRIPEAWKDTKGHAGRIFGVLALLFLVVIAAELVLFGLGAAIASAFMPLGDIGRSFTENPGQLFAKVNPAVWALLAVAWSLFGTWYATIAAAALADIYRQMQGPDTAEVFS